MEMEYEARQKEGLTDRNLAFLDSLLRIQQEYPQLTAGQWRCFRRTFFDE